MIINIIIIIILILFVVGISLFLINYFKSKSGSSTGTGTAPPSGYCTQYPNAPECINLIQCGILDPKTIKKCDSDDTICQNCQCGTNTDPSSRIICMTCQETDGNSFMIDIPEEQCTDPFRWDTSGPTGTCYISKGKYCLPNDTNPDIPCSPYTGRKLLTQATPTSPYEWKCICTDDTKFTNDPLSGDCIGVNICNMKGKPNPPVISNSQRAFVKKNQDGSQTLWNGTNFDPKDGVCHCLETEDFVPTTMQCVIDTCEPGHSDGKGGCTCPPGYVDCNSLTYNGQINFGNCSPRTCIPDPCLGDPPNPNNRYQPGVGCVCDSSSNDFRQKYYPLVSKAAYPDNLKCVQLCSLKNDPCQNVVDDSFRGTCYVDSSQTNSTIWKGEKAQVQNTSNYYWNIKWLGGPTGPNNTYYLNENSNVLTIEQGQGGVPLQVYDAQNPTFNVPQMMGSYNYIFRLYDPNSNTSGNYLNFSSRVFDVASLPDPNDPSYPNYVMTFKGTDVNTGNIIISIDSQTNVATYLNVDYKNNVATLSSNQSFPGTARCKCCYQPYTQDDTYLCRGTQCVEDGQPVSRDYNNPECSCCSAIDANNGEFTLCQTSPNPTFQPFKGPYGNMTTISAVQLGGLNGICGKDYSEGGNRYTCP